MKKFFLSLFIAVIGISAISQKTINDPNVDKRNVSGYHAIEVSGGIDLFLSQGQESVAVSASEIKFREKIKTEVNNGVLKIWYDNNSSLNLDWGNRKLKAYVSFKNLDQLGASGGSDILVDGAINVNTLSLGISGGSDFEGKVQTNELKVKASGGSDVDISGITKTFFTFVYMMITQLNMDSKATLVIVRKRYSLVRDCVLE